MNDHVYRFSILAMVFACAIALIATVYVNAPTLELDEKEFVKLPRNLDDAKALGRVLSRYTDRYFYTVLLGVSVTYLILQSFAIPGSIFLSILSGYLFPFPLALGLICTCSATGAVICYLLSYLIGRQLVLYYWPDRVQQWCKQVSAHRDHLFNYILFLRITPFLPNWFINIASPVIDVPLFPFFWGTFFGVAPPSFFFVKMGQTLHELTSASPQLSYLSIALLALFALGSLAPVVFRQKLKAKIE
jgi:uncharacterized membrane protein YdjX (TVP38/TMEM64 family)